MARIFVTTYHAYNCGKQFQHGQWVDFADFDYLSDLDDACRAIYAHEADPEFMVTDYEDFPREWYSECGLPSEAIFSLIKGYSEHDDTDAIDAFLACRSESFDDWDALKEAFNNAYAGQFSSDEDFADDFIEQTGMLDGVSEDIKRYFDYAAFGRDLMMNGYCSSGGYYFRS